MAKLSGLSEKEKLQKKYQTANIMSLMGIIIMGLALIIILLGGESKYVLAYSLIGQMVVLLGYVYKSRHVRCPHCDAMVITVKDSCPYCKEEFDKKQNK